MTTNVYDTYQEFIDRDNKEDNGVDVKFSVNNEDFVAMNESNEGCWNCKDCKDCYFCISCEDCRDCEVCDFGRESSDCELCIAVDYCKWCFMCDYCYGLEGESDLECKTEGDGTPY